MQECQLWKGRYYIPELIHDQGPRPFLVSSADFFPSHGLALDLAAGEGRNSVFVAARLGLKLSFLMFRFSSRRIACALRANKVCESISQPLDLTKFVVPQTAST
jgi:hypothetical protein